MQLSIHNVTYVHTYFQAIMQRLTLYFFALVVVIATAVAHEKKTCSWVTKTFETITHKFKRPKFHNGVPVMKDGALVFEV